jgi:DNA-damage-inducible protein J
MCYILLKSGGDTMSKTAMVRARVEPDLKERAESVFARVGLSPTQAITLFYKQVELRDGLPFDVVIPTPTTRRAFENSESGRDLVICKDADDMFRKLGI